MNRQTIAVKMPYAGMQNEFDILCVDTEFSDLPFPKEDIFGWRERAEVLSIGIQALNTTIKPESFYAIRKMNVDVLNKCSKFVRENVIPYINLAESNSTYTSVKDLKNVVAELIELRNAQCNKPIAIASDWIGDSLLLSPLFPEGTIYFDLERLPQIQSTMSEAFGDGLVRHNASHDALVLSAGLAKFLF